MSYLLVGEKRCVPTHQERDGNRLVLTFEHEHYVYLCHKLWWVSDEDALERERVVLHTTMTTWLNGHGTMVLTFAVHPDVGT